VLDATATLSAPQLAVPVNWTYGQEDPHQFKQSEYVAKSAFPVLLTHDPDTQSYPESLSEYWHSLP
jgi:hypothetical protein